MGALVGRAPVCWTMPRLRNIASYIDAGRKHVWQPVRSNKRLQCIERGHYTAVIATRCSMRLRRLQAHPLRVFKTQP
eukprot:1772624-Alexandrium_andersonii.AAC.1